VKKYLILAAIFAVAVAVLVLEIRHRHALAVKDAAIAQAAKDIGAVKADLVSAQTLIAVLQRSKIADVGKIVKAGGTPTTYAKITTAVSDTAKGTEKTEAGKPCPVEWSDEYHRFHVDLSTGLLTRQQLFTLELAVFRDASGKQQYVKGDFREYDPQTKAEIPVTGATLGVSVEVNDEKPPGPSRWHLRGIAVIDYRGAFGVGAYAEPIQHVTVGALGVYSTKDKDFRAALFAGYRPFNWTVSVGPYLGISSKAGTLTGGVAVAIEVTR
jgi:hypothetical protein